MYLSFVAYYLVCTYYCSSVYLYRRRGNKLDLRWRSRRQTVIDRVHTTKQVSPVKLWKDFILEFTFAVLCLLYFVNTFNKRNSNAFIFSFSTHVRPLHPTPDEVGKSRKVFIKQKEEKLNLFLPLQFINDYAIDFTMDYFLVDYFLVDYFLVDYFIGDYLGRSKQRYDRGS